MRNPDHDDDHEISATVACNALATSAHRPPRRAEDRNPGVELGSLRPPVRQTEKLAISAAARARKSNDVADYPNPDLAIEIDISPSQVDRPEIYAALQVAEVWRFDGESMTIEQLGPDGKYITSESSRFLPIRTEEVIRWLAEEDVSDILAWERWLRAWIHAELAPRLRS